MTEWDQTKTSAQFTDPSALQMMGPRPLLVQGFLLSFLRTQYADRMNNEQPVFNRNTAPVHDYLWRAELSTGIVIETLNNWKPGQVEKRSAIIANRNKMSVERKGLNDMHHGIPAIDGLDSYSTFMVGSTTLFCIAGESGEVELLAAETYRWAISFAGTIRAWLGLMRFIVTDVDRVYILDDEANENFVVPITVAYAWEERWTVRPHAPLLKGFTIDLTDLNP